MFLCISWHNSQYCCVLQSLQKQALTQRGFYPETYDVQLQRTKVLCTQQRRQVTLMQPLQCHLHMRWLTRISLCTWRGNRTSQQSYSRSTAICSQRCNKHTELRTHENNRSLQNTEEEPIREVETASASPVANTVYLSSPAAATLHRKTQGFVLRLSAQ